MIRRIADAYGAERMLWGSDHPWIDDVPGYAAQLTLAASALADASPSELAEIHGGTRAAAVPAPGLCPVDRAALEHRIEQTPPRRSWG